MPIPGFNQFAKELEKHPRPVQNRLASDSARIYALPALMAGRGAGLPDDTRLLIAAAALSRLVSLLHDVAQDQDTHDREQAPAWAVAAICAAIRPGDCLIGAVLGALSRLPGLTGLLAGVMAAGRVRSDQHEQIMRQSGPLPGPPIALGTDARIGRIPVGAAAIAASCQPANDLTDKVEDPKARLNDHWLWQGLPATGAVTETVPRARLEWYLFAARQSVKNLPALCMAAFEALIEALRQPYPARGAAA